jgi:hypothetical protein
MKRTSALFVRGIVAFAVFAIENAASAQTFSTQAGWLFPPLPLPQWIYPLQPQRGAGWYQTQPYAPAVSPLRSDINAGVPSFRLGSRGPALLPANQSGGVCRARNSARGVELQRNGL